MENVRILFLFFWEYMAHIFMKMNKMSDCRTFSLIQGVLLVCQGVIIEFIFVSSDPEVHIGLENLQHFPAFGSPPQSGSQMQLPEFLLGPLSPLSGSPSSGNTQPLLPWPSVVSLLCLSPVFISDGVMFPNLSEHSPSLSVASVEEDSHCMSFAQVYSDCLKHFLS